MTTAQTFNQELVSTLRTAIEHSDKSQREIAATTGIPLVTLNRKLRGYSPLNFLELAAIASVIGEEVTDLVQRAEQALAPASA